MLTSDQLKQVVHFDNRSQRDCILIILAVDVTVAKDITTIREIGACAGVRKVKSWNISDILAKAVGLAIKTYEGWELTDQGQQYIQSLIHATDLNVVITNASQSLRQHLKLVTKPKSAVFIEEAIVCFEARQYRAAVILSWVGAISILHHEVFNNHLTKFNAEALRRDKKARQVKNIDGFCRTGEHDFLNVIEYIGIIGKNVKQTLQNHCLQLRNACGHPNSLNIAENAVASHIEILTLNVFSRF
ncbi:MAG: hypothetical protein IH984_11765 [Planctomycetes bacterium]|nr:hypothetical protein [Planctomycetota bacterium]